MSTGQKGLWMAPFLDLQWCCLHLFHSQKRNQSGHYSTHGWYSLLWKRPQFVSRCRVYIHSSDGTWRGHLKRLTANLNVNGDSALRPWARDLAAGLWHFHLWIGLHYSLPPSTPRPLPLLELDLTWVPLAFARNVRHLVPWIVTSNYCCFGSRKCPLPSVDWDRNRCSLWEWGRSCLHDRLMLAICLPLRCSCRLLNTRKHPIFIIYKDLWAFCTTPMTHQPIPLVGAWSSCRKKNSQVNSKATLFNGRWHFFF